LKRKTGYMKKSCWGCRHHYTSARRTEGGIYLDSSCDKYNLSTGEDPWELTPGCYEALTLKRHKRHIGRQKNRKDNLSE